MALRRFATIEIEIDVSMDKADGRIGAPAGRGSPNENQQNYRGDDDATNAGTDF
jgi:hypothetical protein